MKMARSGGGPEFEEAKRAYQRGINQELEEAVRLMRELRQNLCRWAEETGEVEKVAQVWSMFQNRLATLKSAATTINKQVDIPQT